jgi:hypothetical protein
MPQKMRAKVNSYIFLAGIVVAIIVGILIGADTIDPFASGEDTPGVIAAVLGLLGLIAGILNVLGMGTVTKEELPVFMMAAIIIVALGAITFGGIELYGYHIGEYLDGIVSALAIFIAPLAGLIAIKAIWDIGKD